MTTRSALSGALLCIALLAVGCGSPSGPTDKPSAEPASPAPAPAQTQMTTPAPVEEAQVAAVPMATDEPASVVAPVAAPVTAPQALAESPVPPPVAATLPPPAAPAATSSIADPGGTVAVAATKPGLERIGAEACGDCHGVQFDSWAGSAHAKRKPPLDCEHCRGPGSGYESKSVMKDPAKAKVVMPDEAFCAKCHKSGVDDAFMEKAHEHEGQLTSAVTDP